MKRTTMLLTWMALASTAGAQVTAGPDRPVHTYSIVARDAATGQMGVAVQSNWFSVGTLVPWAEAGVGAVATQSFVDTSYGPLGLELMRAGKTAQQALDALISADPGRDVRQVAMVDRAGNVAVHTGASCIAEAGHTIGIDYSVQANMMLNPAVWGAMSSGFEAAGGDLADRMMAALDAAQAAGGDIRGKQSAAILVVAAESTGRPWADRIVDLRVEDSTEPLVELRRLLRLQRAYGHMNSGDLAMERGDVTRALEEYGAAGRMVPDNLEMKFWHAVALVNVRRVEESLPLFRQIFAADRNWAILLERLPASNLLIADRETIDRIVREAP